MDALDFVNILIQNKHNMINTIFEAREEDLAKLDKPDTNIMEKEKIEEKHSKFKKAVNIIPIECQKNKKDILDLFEKYCDSVDDVNAYFNKKYYKERTERWYKANDGIDYIKIKY